MEPSNPDLPADSLLQIWDSTVTALVKSSINPQCSTLGGDLYILIGAGILGAAEDGDNKCQMKLLWSAMCCAVPEGKSGFTVGLIREAEEEERQVSLKELEEILGVAELFSEGCGAADGEAVGITVGLHSKTARENVEKQLDAKSDDSYTDRALVHDKDSNTAGPVNEGKEVGSDTNNQEANDVMKESGEDVQSDEADVAHITQESSVDAVTSESSAEYHDVTSLNAIRSQSPETLSEDENVDEELTDTNTSSTVVAVLSTTMSILKAPLRPMFSTVTQLPGQVIQPTEPFRLL